MRDWWNDAGQTSTSTEGFLTELELGSCCVVASKIADGVIAAAKIATSAVETAKIAEANVTSCKLSTNALTRVVVIPFTKLASTETASLWTSAHIVMMPTVPITLTNIMAFPTGAWQNATCDHFTFFRNSSACVADVGFRSIASTVSLLGVASCVGTITNAAIAAGTVLTIKSNVSTCSVTTDASIVVHYTTTA